MLASRTAQIGAEHTVALIDDSTCQASGRADLSYHILQCIAKLGGRLIQRHPYTYALSPSPPVAAGAASAGVTLAGAPACEPVLLARLVVEFLRADARAFSALLTNCWVCNSSTVVRSSCWR